jgi:hypothetical protein
VQGAAREEPFLDDPGPSVDKSARDFDVPEFGMRYSVRSNVVIDDEVHDLRAE